MTKRSVPPQAQRESNKRQRGGQATDGTSHSNNQLAQASIKDSTKHGLMDIETKTPGSIRDWTIAACSGNSEAFNSIAPMLMQLTINELVTIETKAPGTICRIAFAAYKGYAEALNSISKALGELDKDMLLDIETKAPSTIKAIACAAIKGHGKVLNSIAQILGKLDKEMLLAIETKVRGTISIIAMAGSGGHASSSGNHCAYYFIAPILKQLTKNELMTIEIKTPGTIGYIARAADEHYPSECDSLTHILEQLDKSELIDIETMAPGTIMHIAEAAKAGHLTATLGKLDKDELLAIETNTPGTIGYIASADCDYQTKACDSLVHILEQLDKSELIVIETEAPGTIKDIALAACEVYSKALYSLAAILAQLDKSELIVIETDAPGTIMTIAEATQPTYTITTTPGTMLNNVQPINSYTQTKKHLKMLSDIDMAEATRDWQAEALNNIAAIIGLIDKDELLEIEYNAPGTIMHIAEAAKAGHPTALNNIADTLGLLDKDALLETDSAHPTIHVIARAASDGHPAALNNIAATLGLLTQYEITVLSERWDTIGCIAKAVVAGHPKAFLAILDYFFIVENDQPKPNLPECIYNSIREGEYDRCFSIVTVLAEIKKRYPSCFDKVITDEFKQITEWHSTITALQASDDILDYIKKTVLKYNTQDAARCSIKFLDKLIEFYEESNPIVCDESDLTVFIEKVKRYRSQWSDVAYLKSRVIISMRDAFMAPTSEHVVASISLFSESYYSLRAKYKTLVGINKSAGGLLHLEQCETLSDAHNEIVELFRHFILCLKNDLSASQMTFCYDDIDNFLRCYDYGEARQLLLDDLQHLDRHHPQHALFKAQS